MAISFIMSVATTCYGVARADSRADSFEHVLGNIDEFRRMVGFIKGIMAEGIFIEAVRAALLYAVTVLSLKRGLNLA